MLCLPKSARERISQALADGDLSIKRLYDMTSSERNTMLAHYVGESFAKPVNAKFEQAMLSNQKKAMSKWVEKVTEPQTPARRDMMKRIDRVEKFLTPDEEHGFLNDLAEVKLGLKVTEEEAKTILNLKKAVDETRAAIPKKYIESETTIPISERPQEAMAYGFARSAFRNYVQELKEEASNLTFQDRKKMSNMMRNLWDVAGVTKSLKGSLDNSFMGRQGLGVLLRGNVDLWGKNFLNSFKTFGQELTTANKDTSVLDAIHADIFSRPNSLNGTYEVAPNKYGLDLLTEEMYPSLDPQRIPLLGRFFKASSTAFNGTALQLRADLADAFIAQAKQNGIDVMDPREARGLGLRVGTLTGRGELEATAPIGDKVNLLLFAPRFLRSRFNILTGGQAYKNLTPYARKQAALDTVRIATGIGATLTTANLLGFDVETDPRSSKFGQICYGAHCMDTTGGIRGLATLASRIVPTMHNGQWGFWTKSGSTGKYTHMSQGEFGEQTALGIVEQFLEGKASPPLGLLRDIWKGETYEGDKPTVSSSAAALTVPIGIENAWKNFEAGEDDQVFLAISEALGFSTSANTLFPSGKRWTELKEKEGSETQTGALKTATERYDSRLKTLQASPRWDKMTNEEQSTAMDKIRTEETDRVLGKYGL